MTQAYIIIDMQNDFIDGALGSSCRSLPEGYAGLADLQTTPALYHVGHNPGKAILWLSGSSR